MFEVTLRLLTGDGYTEEQIFLACPPTKDMDLTFDWSHPDGISRVVRKIGIHRIEHMLTQYQAPKVVIHGSYYLEPGEH